MVLDVADSFRAHLREFGRDQFVGDGREVRIALRQVTPLLVRGIMRNQHLNA